MFIPIRAAGEAESGESRGSPLHRLEHTLHPWVAFGVLPIFAFANAGVSFAGLSVGDAFRPVPLGIAGGLFIGKQIGVLGCCWLAVRIGAASRPEGISWRQLHGVSLLCGIGFTMSLFMASLAFEPGNPITQDLERLGILVGTVLSGIAGYIALRASCSQHSPTTSV